MGKRSWMMGLMMMSTGGVAMADASGSFGSSESVAERRMSSCDSSVVRGTMRIQAGPGTHSAGSLPIAAEDNAASPVIPVIARDASASEIKQDLVEPGWTIDIDANLGRRARPGNLVVAVYDADDARAMARSEVTALHQVRIDHNGCVSLRVELSPDEGARPNHNYRIQLVQLAGHHKVVLADGVVALK